jgi:subfamily B ATP-binding cassette protein MsbA
VTDTFVVIGLLAWLFWLNWKLTTVTLIAAPVISIIVTFFNRRLRDVSRASQHAVGHLNTVADEAIACQRVIKVFGGQPLEEQRFGEASNRLRQMQMKQTVASASFVPLVQLVAAISIAVIVWLAIEQTSRDETTVGGFVSFITAMIMLLAPLKRLSDISESLQRGLAAAESIFELLDLPPETDSGTLEIGRARGELRFDRVSFQYPRATRPAVEDFSLVITPGQTVALVGSSGSGKTTIANLVPRFLSPDSGTILLDQAPLETLTLRSLRQNIAFVSQDTLLFNDTLANNIAYGPLRGTPHEEVVAAARAAHALEFIEALPQGFDTPIGENGARLSGGQRQRIAIARAILKNAPILVLDEATSALDTESERHVQAALDALMKNRTTLVIAHRLSTIEKADLIVVMSKGRIVETGSHAELLAKEGIYARLIQMQSADLAHLTT